MNEKDILEICASFYEQLFTDMSVQECDNAATSVCDSSLAHLSFSDSISTRAYLDTGESLPPGDHPYIFLPDDSTVQLMKDEAESMGAPLDFKEFRSSLLSMKKNKAPGLDGITVEFYQDFF